MHYANHVAPDLPADDTDEAERELAEAEAEDECDDCPMCGGSGGGPECFGCPLCRGSGTYRRDDD